MREREGGERGRKVETEGGRGGERERGKERRRERRREGEREGCGSPQSSLCARSLLLSPWEEPSRIVC